jgi:hypothetical protein
MTTLKGQAEYLIIWDLNDPSGPAQVQVHRTTALEWFARDTQSRYVENLSGQTPGPKIGLKRIIIDSLSDANIPGH